MSTTQLREDHARRVHARQRNALPALIEHVLSLQARSVLIWGITLGALGLMYIAIFPTFADQQEQLDDMINNLPQSVTDLMGLGASSGFGTIEAFLSTEMFNLLAPLALAFFPILATSSTISGAEEQGTIDVMMGNPLPRWQLVVSSYVATALSLLGILALMGVIMWLTALAAGVDLSVGDTVNGVLNLWPLCISFGALAMLCSALFRRRTIAVALPGGLLVLMYVVNGLGRGIDWLEPLRPITAFYYYGSAVENGIDWPHFGILILAAVVLTGLAIVAFQRRDIYT